MTSNQRQTIQNQNLVDMCTVAVILGQILVEKELTAEEDRRVKYCTKVLKNVKEKHNAIR